MQKNTFENINSRSVDVKNTFENINSRFVDVKSTFENVGMSEDVSNIRRMPKTHTGIRKHV